MATVPSSRLLFSRLRRSRMDSEIGILFQPAIDKIVNLLTSQGEIIDTRNLNTILAQAGTFIDGIFVGLDGRNAYGSDGVTPLSPFASWLNREIASVQAQVSLAHVKQMERMLPPDIIQWLRTARPKIEEQRKFLKYIPTHEWEDERGFRLSDRIWITSQRTRTQLDGLLRDGIRNQTSSLDLAQQVRQFLQPGQFLKATNKPYGRNANFNAMRIARTEISFAHAQASMKAAQDNPFVTGVDVALSNRHVGILCCDICDELTSIAADGSRKREPFELGAAEIPPFHPHCLCHVRPSVETTRKEVIDSLREQMRKAAQAQAQAQPPAQSSPALFPSDIGEAPFTPLAGNGWVLDLLGLTLGAYIDTKTQRDLIETTPTLRDDVDLDILGDIANG